MSESVQVLGGILLSNPFHEEKGSNHDVPRAGGGLKDQI